MEFRLSFVKNSGYIINKSLKKCTKNNHSTGNVILLKSPVAVLQNISLQCGFHFLKIN